MDALRPENNDERRAHWAAKYFGAGFHRRAYSTARNPQGSDTGVSRKADTLARQSLKNPRGAGFADAAFFPDQPDPDDALHPSGRPLTYDELAHGF